MALRSKCRTWGASNLDVDDSKLWHVDIGSLTWTRSRFTPRGAAHDDRGINGFLNGKQVGTTRKHRIDEVHAETVPFFPPFRPHANAMRTVRCPWTKKPAGMGETLILLFGGGRQRARADAGVRRDAPSSANNPARNMQRADCYSSSNSGSETCQPFHPHSGGPWWASNSMSWW